MASFRDVLYGAIDDFNTLASKIDENGLEQKLLSDDLKDDIYAYIDFLDAIPDEDKEKVATELVEKIYSYKLKLDVECWNEIKKAFMYQGNEAPIKTINRDLKTTKAFKEMINRLLPLEPQEIKTEHNVISRELHSVVDVLLYELKNKQFSFINTDSYYERPVPTKIELKNFLSSVVEEYDIKNASLQMKQLIDNIK